MNIFESGQDREIAALRINVHVHHLFWSDIVKDDKYMKIALKEAYKAFDKNEIPVGAVIVLNGKVIAKAHNLKDSTGIVTNHAEILAIQKANRRIKDWRLNGATMYITLEPCTMCASAIVQSRISNVIYAVSSNNDSNKIINSEILKSSSTKMKLFHHESINKEIENLLRNFFEKIR